MRFLLLGLLVISTGLLAAEDAKTIHCLPHVDNVGADEERKWSRFELPIKSEEDDEKTTKDLIAEGKLKRIDDIKPFRLLIGATKSEEGFILQIYDALEDSGMDLRASAYFVGKGILRVRLGDTFLDKEKKAKLFTLLCEEKK